MVLALTAFYDHHLYSFDIKTAFLHSKLEEEVYIAQIPGFEDDDPDIVLRLKVALYGLKQAAFAWYCHFMQAIVDIGLKRCELDHAFFIGTWTTPPDDSITMPANGDPLRLLVPIHVDDGLASTTNSEPLYKWFVSQLESRGIQVKDLGVASMFLAIRIHRDRPTRRLWLSQAPFIKDLLDTWQMNPCKGVYTPMEGYVILDDDDSKGAVLREDIMHHKNITKAYQSLVGSFNYLAMWTRGDIAFATQMLGRFNATPEKKHLVAAKRVLRYLYQTRNLVLMFDGGVTVDPSVDSLVRSATGFVDADWASDEVTRVSVSGYVFFFLGGAVSWSSVRQRVIALSSTEAEYYAIVHGVKEGLWMRLFLMICGFPVPSPFPILVDNKSALAQVSSPAVTARSKHIHIRELFIKQYFSDGTFQANWVSTNVNVADIFTKPLSRVLFEKFRLSLGIVDFPLISSS